MKDMNKEPAGSWECTRRADKRKGDCGRGERRKRWTKRAGERVRERGRESFSVHSQSWCAISNPPVRGFVPWPSRKWELGRQQLTKELWRIQLAINGQPQAFVLVTMVTAQHHYTKITKPLSALLLFSSSSSPFSFFTFYTFILMSLLPLQAFTHWHTNTLACNTIYVSI